MTVRNRLYRAPVLEGAGDGPDAAERYAKALRRQRPARRRPDHPGQLVPLRGGADVAGHDAGRTRASGCCAWRRWSTAVHAEGAAILLQVGHGGLYAMEAWHEPYASQRKGPLLAPSPVPWLLEPVFRGVPIHVMTTRRGARDGPAVRRGRGVGPRGGLRRHPARRRRTPSCSTSSCRRSTTAAPTSSAGRPSGGRAILRLIREAVAERAGDDYPCTVKIPAETGAAVRAAHVASTRRCGLCGLVEEWGFDAVTPVEVSVFPDTTLEPRRRARVDLDEQGDEGRASSKAAPSRRAAGRSDGGRRGRRQAQPVRAGVEPRRCSGRRSGGCRSRCSRSAASAPRAEVRRDPRRRRRRHGRHRPAVLRRARPRRAASSAATRDAAAVPELATSACRPRCSA